MAYIKFNPIRRGVIRIKKTSDSTSLQHYASSVVYSWQVAVESYSVILFSTLHPVDLSHPGFELPHIKHDEGYAEVKQFPLH
jgi:hypothetical protein